MLRYALEDPALASVVSIGRRTLGIEHAKLREIVHADFSDCRGLAAELAGIHAAVYCLGAYTGTVPDEQFRRITVDYTVAFAEALHSSSPDAAFVLLSGQGADLTERSRIPFARYKGAAEKALMRAGFSRVHLFRPGYIYPVTARQEPNFGYRVLRRLYPLLRRVYPNIGVDSESLARQMLDAALWGTPGHSSAIIENREIRLGLP